MSNNPEEPLSLEALKLADTLRNMPRQWDTPFNAPYMVQTNCKEEAKVERVNNIGQANGGYCSGQASLGTVWTQLPAYPPASLPHRTDTESVARRSEQLTEARIENVFNDELLPGAVVHGNVSSPDVRDNNLWTLRGTAEERAQFAHEGDFGVDDSDPGIDGATDFFEALYPYIEKNWRVWATNPRAVNNLQRLLSILVENAMDPDGNVKLDFMDHILVLFPAARTMNIAHWDFFPESPPEHPKKYQKPAFFDDYRDDDVVGWMQVAAASPYTRLQPYTEHQENFQVTKQMFQATPEFRTDDLDAAMSEGRVFIVDWKDFHFHNIKPSATESDGGRFFTPIAMFAVPKEGGPLKLIAIQSTQDTPKDSLERLKWKYLNIQDPQRPLSDILTPGDDYWSWQMTKTLFLSMYAISNVIDHLSTHVYLGPIPISFYRNIPSEHPLTALLDTHMMSLVVNNHEGIFWELGQNVEEYGRSDHGVLSGMANKLTGWTGQTFIDATVDFAGRYHFVKDSTPINRDTDEQYRKIEDFPLYDDDQLFPVIERWVRSYLSLYYESDADVVQDYELQAFCHDTVHEGKVKGFPESVDSIEALVDMVARLVYWLSVNHSLDNALAALHIAPVGYWSDRVPRNDESRTEMDWFNILPPINVAMSVFCASRIFVDLPNDWHRSLGKFPQGQFMHDQRIYEHLDQFQRELKEVDDGIVERNKSRRWAYNMKRPSTMTCSPWN